MARKKHYEGRLSVGRAFGPDQVATTIGATQSAALSPVDRWSARAASWAQVATLAVVIVGYVYTVIPVFQKERLEEEVAKLENQRDRTEVETKRAQEVAEKLEQNIAHLRREESTLSQENRALLEEKSQLIEARDYAVSQRDKALISVQTTNAQREKAIALYELSLDRIFHEAISWQFTATSMNEYAKTGDSPFRSTSAGIVDTLKTQWLDPVAEAQKIIDNIRAEKALGDMPEGYTKVASRLDDLERRLHARARDLETKLPDFKAWQDTFHEQLAFEQDNLPSCVEAYFRRRQNEEHWTDAQMMALRKTDFWPQQSKSFQITCEIAGKFSVEQRYMQAWSKLYEKHMELVVSVPDILLNEEEVPTITDDLLQPPKKASPWFSDPRKM